MLILVLVVLTSDLSDILFAPFVFGDCKRGPSIIYNSATITWVPPDTDTDTDTTILRPWNGDTDVAIDIEQRSLYHVVITHVHNPILQHDIAPQDHPVNWIVASTKRDIRPILVLLHGGVISRVECDALKR